MKTESSCVWGIFSLTRVYLQFCKLSILGYVLLCGSLIFTSYMKFQYLSAITNFISLSKKWETSKNGDISSSGQTKT